MVVLGRLRNILGFLAFAILLFGPIPPVFFPDARPMDTSDDGDAAVLLPDQLNIRSVPSVTLLHHKYQLAVRLAPVNVRQEEVRLVIGHLPRGTPDMILGQMYRSKTGKHFIPLLNDANGNKVYAMELRRPPAMYSDLTLRFYQGKNGEKRFALLGVSTASPTALSLYRGPPSPPTRPTVSLYGVAEVASASFNTMSDVANAHSDVLHSHSLASFLHP
ncbi:uncharacterized protein SPSC_00081 [Sporisorium scitamineum]|uniref:Uncharacterized protein n=1 Tax=Sporisorium scitamineum TaxID=49012 RepID=A0A127Z7E5_9BASI|nr:uncharacterized protein SPSC_00081 [Sporisorium scitamineum]